MVDKYKLKAEEDKLRRKGTMLLWDKHSAFEEMKKIMFRLNYLKGTLFALGEVDA